jgi:Hypothetical glycosyl hydrolase family 15
LNSSVARINDAVKRAGVLIVLAVAFSALGAVALTSAYARSSHHGRRTRHTRHQEYLARAAAGSSVALFDRAAYSFPSAPDVALEARRYSVMILQAPWGRLVPLLHHYNPRLKIYMYQFIMYARADDPRGLELCSSLPAAVAHNWFLRGAGGLPLRVGPAYGLDIGIPSFQQACAAHATALAKRSGFDGVFLDGVGTLPDYEFGGSVSVPKYRAQSSWMAAMTAFLQTMTNVAHASGLRVVANIGGPQAWLRWASILDGAAEESWTDGGLGLAQQLPWWKEKLQNVAWSEAHGKLSLLHSYNTSEAANVYGLSSMLLVADGHSSYTTSNANYLGAEEWFPEYGLAERLGAPRGHYRRLRSGLYERRFANGLVLVNPTLGSVGRVALHETYSGSGFAHARSVSLGPTSGLIMVRG